MEHAFDIFPCAREMKISWPACYQAGTKQLSDYTYDKSAVPWLMNSVPANGQPLSNLTSIVIRAHSMNACIPAQLPNLQSLVVRSRGYLELHFEDLQATLLALTPLWLWAATDHRLSKYAQDIMQPLRQRAGLGRSP